MRRALFCGVGVSPLRAVFSLVPRLSWAADRKTPHVKQTVVSYSTMREDGFSVPDFPGSNGNSTNTTDRYGGKAGRGNQGREGTDLSSIEALDSVLGGEREATTSSTSSHNGSARVRGRPESPDQPNSSTSSPSSSSTFSNTPVSQQASSTSRRVWKNGDADPSLIELLEANDIK